MSRSLARFLPGLAPVAICLLCACGSPPAEEEASATAKPAKEAKIAAPVTQTLAEQVLPGMSVEEVTAVLGREGELDDVEFYRWEGGLVVAFRDGEAVEGTGIIGALGKTADEIAESRGAPGTKLARDRYVWENEPGAGSLTVDFEDGKVVGRTATMLPES